MATAHSYILDEYCSNGDSNRNHWGRCSVGVVAQDCSLDHRLTNEGNIRTEVTADTTHCVLRPAVSIEDAPPNGGYGWVCVACMFVINMHTWGLNSAWGIFLAYYLSHDTFHGASNFLYALIGGLSISQALIISPLSAISVRRYGTRTTLLIGTLLVALSLFGASLATRIWHLILSQGICFGWGMGFLYVTASAILPQWFSTRRSLATGIASSGAGIGGLIYNLVAARAVETVGIKWTYRTLAFCGLGANLVCSFPLKDRNQFVKPEQQAFDYRACRKVQVVLVMLWGVLTELGYITLLYSLPHFAISIGLTPQQGSIVGALLNLGLGIGRPVVGYYSDRIGRINMATLMTTMCGFFCLAIWVPAKSFGTLLAFALLSGTVCGTFWGTITPVLAEVVGLQKLPPTFGMICFCLVLPTTFAEPIALQIVQASGNVYLTSQIFVGCAFILAGSSTWLLRSWKINEIEKKAAREIEDSVPSSLHRRRDHDFWLSFRRLLLLTKV